VTTLVTAGALVAGCGTGTVGIDTTELDGPDAERCAALVASLPDSLAGEPRREVDPEGAPGAAWGDPPYVVTCGVPRPDDVARTAPCNEIGGVGWFAPDEELGDPGAEVTATALSHTPYVALEVPSEHRTVGLDAALAELAPVITRHLVEDAPCL